MEKLLVGSHVSLKSPDYLVGSLKETLDNGANCMMIYTGAPQTTKRVDIERFNINEFRNLCIENGIDLQNIVVHAPYIINLSTSDEKKRMFAVDFLVEEIKRCEAIGIKYIVVHPGSHLGAGVKAGLDNLIEAVNLVQEKIVGSNCFICIETMSGKGGEVCTNLEDINYVLQRTKNVYVCLDTCHMHDAGYDFSNTKELMNKIDKTIGFGSIKVIHVNDSKNEMGSRKDRHENIGVGYLGFQNIIDFIYHQEFVNVPKILETPYIGENSPYKEEIKMIKEKKWFSIQNK
jgi:deoxyribonuclease-4